MCAYKRMCVISGVQYTVSVIHSGLVQLDMYSMSTWWIIFGSESVLTVEEVCMDHQCVRMLTDVCVHDTGLQGIFYLCFFYPRQTLHKNLGSRLLAICFF